MLKNAERPFRALQVSGKLPAAFEYTIVLLSLIFFTFLVIRTAWLNDDAYITFRTVDNFVNGYGLTWNTTERVQAYTHPLWLLMLATVYAATHDLYHTGIWLSVLLSVSTLFVLAFGIARTTAAALLGVLILTLSKAFMDYSTSGLENALTHLLLILFLAIYFSEVQPPRALFFLSLIAALGLVNRLDSVLLFLPPLAWVLWEGRGRLTGRQMVLSVVAGFLPLVAWEFFSLIYYGFPLPNTAYAKADNLGIERMALWQQGLSYFQNSLRWDPLTLTTILLGLLASLLARERRWYPLGIGILLYLVYVLTIGGDFMSGRFLTAPLLVATALLVRLDFFAAGRPAVWPVATLLIVVLGLSAKHPAIFYGGEYGSLPDQRDNWTDGDIADERMYYYPFTGLLNPARQPHPWRMQGEEIGANGPRTIEHGNIGFLGYYAGPAIHIIDRNGLADPLLARLPVRDSQNWRVGHFRRHVPDGYTQTRATGDNLIQQPDLALYYEVLARVTQGTWLGWQRLIEIWRLNTGQYDYLLQRYVASTNQN